MTVPAWRTDTVVALCRAVRQTKDYAVLPILADALEDAGYADHVFLAELRAAPTGLAGDRLVALVYSDATAAAVGWLDKLARRGGSTCINYDALYAADGVDPIDRPITYEIVVQAGCDYVDRHDYFVQYGSEGLRDALYDPQVRRHYWRCWAAVTGRTAPPDPLDEAPFDCSC